MPPRAWLPLEKYLEFLKSSNTELSNDPEMSILSICIIKADGNIHIQKLCYKLGVVGEMIQWLRVGQLFQRT